MEPKHRPLPLIGYDLLIRWLIRILIVALGAAGLLWLVGRRTRGGGASRRGGQQRRDEDELDARRPERVPGRRYIHVAARRERDSASLANALLGTRLFGGHAPDEAGQYRDLWWLRQMPAVALRLADRGALRSQVDRGDIVVLKIEPRLHPDERRLLAALQRHFAEVRRLVYVDESSWAGGDAATGDAVDKDLERDYLTRSLTVYVEDPADIVWSSRADGAGPSAPLRARLDALTAPGEEA